MTDAGIADRRFSSLRMSTPRPLRFRLTVAFLSVSFVALGLLLTLALVLVRSDVARFSRGQSAAIERGLVASLAVSYRSNRSWSPVAIEPILALATSFETRVTIRAANGTTVGTNLSTVPVSRGLQPPSTTPIIVDGSRVGTITAQLAKNGVVTSGLGLQRSLALAVGISAALAVLVAFAAAILVSGWVARPVLAIASAARDLTDGRWSTRVGHHSRTEELNELGTAFDSLAANLEREDAVRRTLTAQIAHELRTPLAILQGSSEALVDGVLPPSLSTFQSLHDESLRLAHLVEDLERLADAQAAGLHLEVLPVELDQLATNVASELAFLFEDASVEFTTRTEPVAMLGDERRLRQIMSNLLTNAAKFTPAGGHVVFEVGPAGTQDVQIVVADTGIGILEEHLSRLFERFWRSPHSGQIVGSGIGLAVVGELVEAHHGTVKVESELGLGSRFTVTFPQIVRNTSERSSTKWSIRSARSPAGRSLGQAG